MIRQESSEFLRQKQAQWEKEKAESKSRPEWFPFGENSTPGGGSPLRKFVSKEPVEEKRRASQFAAAMEKAKKKEAELLKRAKLYKHVLRGAEEEGWN
ncbi:hypothetical protein CAEBREN_30673 [Caenorhabditis brenneri]|uniref:Uncharacterized protein n=1 Tax=Caenorhabditis brenneri TaxID=135651 RepID=G0NUH7_CAEBE|nr:hypothetical protein CAEBREN_30673 [Caenorhabditis brenneri]